MGYFMGNFYPSYGSVNYDTPDDNGLVLPPSLAPIPVVIVPIHRTDEQLAQIGDVADDIIAKLKAKGIYVKYDDRNEYKPGWKFAEYELKGVPVRVAID